MEDQVPKMLQLRTLEYSHLGQVEREDPDDESSQWMEIRTLWERHPTNKPHTRVAMMRK